MKADHWADAYVEKRHSASAAIAQIRSGQRVFIGSCCGEPQHLVRQLFLGATRVSDLEIVRLLSLESAPLSLVADATDDQLFTIRSFYPGSGIAGGVARRQRSLTPVHLSQVPLLFKSRRLPIHAALIQVAPPDDFGWMSLGVSVDITLAAALSADLVIAQVNDRMPRVLGHSFIHVNDVDVIVEHSETLLTVAPPSGSNVDVRIAGSIRRLIEDGSTVHVGWGSATRAALMALAEKNDIGIHTQYLTDDWMNLVATGVVTNRHKGYNTGKSVASAAVGSENLYAFMDDNPSIELHPSDYVNDPYIIARHHRMVSVNGAMGMDLTGQAAVDASPESYYSGISGISDFIKGAIRAKGGKSIIILPSTFPDGQTSRIVVRLNDTAVVVPRTDVHDVATEYGVVNLFGKNLQERALAMITIAHPDVREALFEQAKSAGLLGPERRLRRAIRGIYPQQLETQVDINGQPVVIRPARPVDERRIQEHYYALDKADVVLRFFQEKKSFYRKEIENRSQIDYLQDLTLVALTGTFGFETVVATAEYYLEPTGNMAEVSFSVSRAFQGQGLGRILLAKLSEAARTNGIGGLKAYISPENRKMIRLFATLPYPIHTAYEDEILVTSCRFENPE